MYDPRHVLYKDNTKKDKCWDAVAANVGATSKYMLLYFCVNGSTTVSCSARSEMRVPCEQPGCSALEISAALQRPV